MQKFSLLTLGKCYLMYLDKNKTKKYMHRIPVLFDLVRCFLSGIHLKWGEKYIKDEKIESIKMSI